MDTNQAGATMASRYKTAKNAAIIGASVFPAGALARGGSMITGSKAYKVYGAVKRPLLTIGVHQKISGATTAMALSKAYSKSLIAASVFNFGRNVQLARAKEYKRLGINVFGPPLSLFLYDNYMAHDMDAEADIATAKKEQSLVGGSLPSKPKTRGKDSYRPSATRYLAYYEGGVGDHEDSICRKGYRYDRKRNLCVRK
ncbi:MAG: hypothetical protein [Circular genetic element sp.]|nr:MAG: hypothetical protein [Circular genetic element sp.]